MEHVGYSEIGAVLRAAREDRHMGLNEVARLLHIRARYLDAIERGDFRELPGIPYAKGYMQAYAVFLELDKDELMRRFERVDGQLAKRNFYLPKAFHSEKKPHNAAVWGSMVAVLVLYSLWHVAGSHEAKKISIVEHFQPKISPEEQASLMHALNPACFKGKSLLYPACYVKKQPEVAFSLAPLQGRPETVMALWDSAWDKPQETMSNKTIADAADSKAPAVEKQKTDPKKEVAKQAKTESKKTSADSKALAQEADKLKPAVKKTETKQADAAEKQKPADLKPSANAPEAKEKAPKEKTLKPEAADAKKKEAPKADKSAEKKETDIADDSKKSDAEADVKAEKPQEETQRKKFKLNEDSHDGNTHIRSSEYPSQ